jgi:hypothetical protein
MLGFLLQSARLSATTVGSGGLIGESRAIAQSLNGIEETPIFLENDRTRRGGRAADCTGLENRLLESTSTSESCISGFSEKDLAFCLALLARKSADLALVVERWDALPVAVKAGIMAMVNASVGATRPI